MFCLGSSGFQLIARHSVSVDQDGLASSEKSTTLKKIPSLFTSAMHKDVFASRNSLGHMALDIHLDLIIYLLLYVSCRWCPIERCDLGICPS